MASYTWQALDFDFSIDGSSGEDNCGRGLHSFTSELNLSRF